MKMVRIIHPTKGELVIDDQHPLVKAEGVKVLGDHIVAKADAGKPVEVSDPAVIALVTRIKAGVGSVTALVAVCAAIAVEHKAVSAEVPEGYISAEQAETERSEAINALVADHSAELETVKRQLKERENYISPEQAEAMVKEALEKQFAELSR